MTEAARITPSSARAPRARAPRPPATVLPAPPPVLGLVAVEWRTPRRPDTVKGGPPGWVHRAVVQRLMVKLQLGITVGIIAVGITVG